MILSMGARAATPDEAGRAVVAQLVAGDAAGVYGRFSPAVQAAVPASKLAAMWRELTGPLGRFRRVESVASAPAGPLTTVTLTCAFAHGGLDVRLTFDVDGRIAGLFFAPPPASPHPPAWSPPPYAAPDRCDERALTLGQAPWPLPAKLTMPRGAGPFPAVVLVHGSGASDENEAIGPNQPFHDLALGLAARGIAVLRFPNRAFAHPSAFKPPARFTVREEAIDDVRAALALLTGSERIDPRRIFLIGHSQGGMLAPRIADGDARVAGLVILAGPTRPIEEVALEQMRDRGTPAELRSLEQAVRRIHDPALRADDWIDFLGQKIPASYFLDLRHYQPAALAARLGLPTLVLQGDRDIQVRAIDFAGWQRALAGRPRAELRRYPTLTHLFMEGQGTLADYERAGHVAPAVLDDIAAFVARTPAHRAALPARHAARPQAQP